MYKAAAVAEGAPYIKKILEKGRVRNERQGLSLVYVLFTVVFI